MTKRWHVATTKHQQETQAASNLREQGFTVYLPKLYIRQQDGRKIEPISTLRFSGYIFIAFDATQEEHGPISNTRSVDELLVTTDGTPVPIPEGIIEFLRRIEDEEFAMARNRAKQKDRTDLEAGDLVRVDRRDHAAFGQQGHLLGITGGVASVLSGVVIWKIADCDLKLVEQERRKTG